MQATAKKLVGAAIHLPFPSVGATENLMMAATLATGETIIENAAREPEIEDLANFLNQCGAKIQGAGSNKINIQGVRSLKGTRYKAVGDRIEAGTYLMMALLTEGDVKVEGFKTEHLNSLFSVFEAMGANFERGEDWAHIKPSSNLKGVEVVTAPYPGFPTDLQAQLLTLCLKAIGPSVLTEKIFENRFMHVAELKRMGAQISLKGETALIKEGHKLKGAPVMCTDLRASAALVMAGLYAAGVTRIQRVYHLDRGYESLDQKLKGLGAQIERKSSD